jgi:outer membrane protein OmpA-like peptidoglycan-associated protein
MSAHILFSATRRARAIAVAAFAGVVGCAPALPPSELVTARTDFARASRGPTAALDPADLQTAGEALQRAEQSFTKDGDSQMTKDLAYIADRRTEIAEAHAATAQATQQQQQTLANMHAEQTAEVQATSAQLGRANAQIALQGQALQTEQQRREDAEKRAAAAAAALAALGSVKQEPRGMVITLSGSVLFASNQSDLLPGAQSKLNDVSDALTKQDSESRIIVEGYTDSQGAPAYNQDLSQRRAQTVRDYLVAHGIAADRVTAQGFGLTKPIADNNSAEGRANNRRVEIVVQPGATGVR